MIGTGFHSGSLTGDAADAIKDFAIAGAVASITEGDPEGTEVKDLPYTFPG